MADQEYGGKPEVPTEALRVAFERSGISKGELAKRLGWMRPNIDKVNRALGLREDTGKSVRRKRNKATYRLASEIVDALPEVDPVDVEGL
jgi:hypothetical protein